MNASDTHKKTNICFPAFKEKKKKRKKMETDSASGPPFIAKDKLAYSNALTFIRALGYPSIYGNTDIFSDEK